MAGVTWGDDSIRIRLLQAATRVSAHFYDAMALYPASSPGSSTNHVDDLNERWRLLRGDLTIVEYEQRLQQELLPLASNPLFGHIRTELGKAFSYDQRLLHVNKAALGQVNACVQAWGGPKAKKRVKEVKLLPLHFESTDKDETQFFFERSAKRILVRAGSHELVLRECMILEFSFFHEYLSHAFPGWAQDVEEISEGWLFALEFDWFEAEYTQLDNDLLRQVWQQRFGRDRRSFWAGRWLLNRCNSRECVRKFLLEWVAGWDDFDQDDNLDLLSQLQGVFAKTGHRLGGARSAKQLKTQELLDASVCKRCEKGKWDIREMRSELASALSVYEPRK